MYVCCSSDKFEKRKAVCRRGKEHSDWARFCRETEKESSQRSIGRGAIMGYERTDSRAEGTRVVGVGGAGETRKLSVHDEPTHA